MALPTLEKTWQFDLNLQNTISGDGAIDLNDIFIQIKNAMKGFGISPWTVVGSSNSVSSNMAGIDLLVTTGDIVHAGATWSWIVLEQTGWNSGAQACFAFSSSTSDKQWIDLVFSPGGLFTGGSTSARPTATDEVIVGINKYWISGAGLPDRQYVAHVMQSTDGASTKIIGCHDGIVSCYLSFENIGNPVSGWSNPAIATLVSVGNADVSSTLMDMDSWYNSTFSPNGGSGYGWWIRADVTTPAFLKVGTEWHRNSVPMVADNYANEISGEYPLTPIGLHNVDLSGLATAIGQRGKYGHVIDQWFTVAAPSTGDNIPGDGSKQFVVVGDFVFPWDGATSMLLG